MSSGREWHGRGILRSEHKRLRAGVQLRFLFWQRARIDDVLVRSIDLQLGARALNRPELLDIVSDSFESRLHSIELLDANLSRRFVREKPVLDLVELHSVKLLKEPELHVSPRSRPLQCREFLCVDLVQLLHPLVDPIA